MIEYRELIANEVEASLFDSFDRTQNVTKCWRKINGEWVIKDIQFIDNWSDEEYIEGTKYLKNLINSGGYAVAAFDNGQLKGFVSVESTIFGTNFKYLNLSNIHVSQDRRGQGIGKNYFNLQKIGQKLIKQKNYTFQLIHQ